MQSGLRELAFARATFRSKLGADYSETRPLDLFAGLVFYLNPSMVHPSSSALWSTARPAKRSSCPVRSGLGMRAVSAQLVPSSIAAFPHFSATARPACEGCMDSVSAKFTIHWAIGKQQISAGCAFYAFELRAA
jgi:hypothetical protein